MSKSTLVTWPGVKGSGCSQLLRNFALIRFTVDKLLITPHLLTLVAIVTLVLYLIVGVTALSASESYPAAPAVQRRNVERGKSYFEDYCASCHHSDGRGVEDAGPPLAGSSWVTGPEIRLIKIVLHGMRGQITAGGKTYNREMLGFGERLADSEIASLLSFVRKRWGGQTAPVKSTTVSRLRSSFPNRTDYWTVDELLRDR